MGVRVYRHTYTFSSEDWRRMDRTHADRTVCDRHNRHEYGSWNYCLCYLQSCRSIVSSILCGTIYQTDRCEPQSRRRCSVHQIGHLKIVWTFPPPRRNTESTAGRHPNSSAGQDEKRTFSNRIDHKCVTWHKNTFNFYYKLCRLVKSR